MYYTNKTPVLLLMVSQVLAIDGQHAPPMPTGIGGVPSPLDHQAFVPGDRF
jgi:hypothetical protein